MCMPGHSGGASTYVQYLKMPPSCCVGAPVHIDCESDQLSVTERAIRTVFNCQQNLEALMRFPCPGDSKGSCDVDYEGKW